MTDKEKAEEYIINKYYKDWLEEESRDVILEDVHAHDENELQVYLDGLTEGKPKWHDLRKDLNDLPEERKRVLLCIETAGRFEDFKVYIEGVYDKGECLGEYNSCWLYQEADKKVLTEIGDTQRVIAWCELPEFKE